MIYSTHDAIRKQSKSTAQAIHDGQLLSPPISGQILCLQVSTQTTTARPAASRNRRRREVRAKHLEGNDNTVIT